MRVTFGIAVALLLASAAPSPAHHAFAVEFDAKACADVTGVLKKVNYENPHAYLFVDTKNAAGQVEEATFQLSSTSNLRRGGATPAVLNASLGKEVVVRGCGSRNGRRTATRPRSSSSPTAPSSGSGRMSKVSSAPRFGDRRMKKFHRRAADCDRDAADRGRGTGEANLRRGAR